MFGLEYGQIIFREAKQSDSRGQSPRVFGMRRMFEILLQMNKRARRLDQAFEKNRVNQLGVEPDLLEHVVRFVVMLFIPALEKGAIKWMFLDRNRSKIDIFSGQAAHELRNPLAFVHGALNLAAAQAMSKSTIFPEDQPTGECCRDQE